MLYPAELRAHGEKRLILSYSAARKSRGVTMRNPFVWEVQVRREVLDDEWAELRNLPYSIWRDIVTSGPMAKTVEGRDGRTYRVVVTAQWDRGSDVRVTLALTRPRGFRRRLLRQTFVVTPQNAVHV